MYIYKVGYFKTVKLLITYFMHFSQTDMNIYFTFLSCLTLVLS